MVLFLTIVVLATVSFSDNTITYNNIRTLLLQGKARLFLPGPGDQTGSWRPTLSWTEC